jgi:hypothetical protein
MIAVGEGGESEEDLVLFSWGFEKGGMKLFEYALWRSGG